MPDTLNAIHFPLAIASRSGRLLRETDYEEYIKQLIFQVLLTAPGERINRPDFGVGIRKLVFAPNSPAIASMTQSLIYQALSTWLGRFLRVDEVRAEASGERLDVIVVYTILARNQRRFLNLEVVL